MMRSHENWRKRPRMQLLILKFEGCMSELQLFAVETMIQDGIRCNLGGTKTDI